MQYIRCYFPIIFFLYGVMSSPFILSASQFNDNSWALLVGIDEYEMIEDLNYAVEDANSINGLLIESLGFPSENIHLLLDADATRDNIRKALRDISKKAGARDRVLIYFAGHGKTEILASGGERGYLLPPEGDPDELYLTSLPMDELKNFSNMTSAKNVLFLMDAC